LAQEIKTIFFNKDYILLFFAFCILFGGFKTLTVCISYIVIPYGIGISDGILEPMKISYLLVAPIPSGLVFSIFFAHRLKKTQNYRIYALFCNLCIILGLVLLYFTLNSPTHNYLYTFLDISLIGAGLIPVIPILTEWAQEVAYPAPESLILGTVIAGG
jgi:Na+/melibiose symporter-like transporter